MKIALVHDWLTGYRGGEKVLEQLCRLYPDAPLYTLVHVRGSVPPLIENRPIHTSFIDKLPWSHAKYRHYLPLFPLAAETLVREKFDLVISTSSAVAKSVRVGQARHWCYIHSPMRYVWDRFDDYFGPELVGSVPSKAFFKPIAAALRAYDRKTAGRVGHYVANSHFVAERVKGFYGIEAEVIHPPVDTEKFAGIQRKPQDHYLCFGAWVPYKKTEQAIEACQRSHRKLTVMGHGPDEKKLRQLADPKWTTFVSHPVETDVLEQFADRKSVV